MNGQQSKADKTGNKVTGGRGGWWFLGVMLAVYLGLFLFRPDLADQALGAFAHLTRTIAPVLLLVFALMFLSNLLLRGDWVRRYVGSASGWRGYAVSTLAGILSTGPIYVWYPFLTGMRAKGMKDALLAVFLYNRALKLPWLPVMVAYFGLRYTVVLSGWMIVAGVLEGLLIEFIWRDRLQGPPPQTR